MDLGDADHPPVALSAGLPGFLLLPNLRNVREAMAAHDADGGKKAMDKKMANLKSHDVHELVPQAKGLQTL